ncbi:MAG TPA: DUF72 domain-containing protein [Puia sp.]|jgi:uncharacterized protein YecE (DUF72 family)|nr:DUF72 domain-containing protein [Puia sp.]
MRRGRVYIGTSGWVYPHWRGLFYPANLPQRLWLQYYAQHFDCTEINGSFYRLPSAAAVLQWQNTVGKEFRFCPKISRFITHAKKLNDPEQGVPRFFEVFDLMASRTGPVLLQLPASVPFQAEKVRHFFEYLTLYHKNFRFSLEARHPSWIEQSALALLKTYRIGWVIADSGSRFASADAVTARHVYARFHGPDGTYASGYSKKYLADFATRCREWRNAGRTVWVFFNNDLNGFAVRDALALKALMAE